MHRLRPHNLETLRLELAATACRSTDSRYLHRLHAVLLVGVGHSCRQVATWLGDDARSIQRWVQALHLRGVDGLQDRPGHGRPARLTPPQQAQLALDLMNDPEVKGYGHGRWSGKLLARHLAREFGVQFSQRHCQRLLQRFHPVGDKH